MSHLIPHEHTKSNRVSGFQTLDAVFPKTLYRLFKAQNKTRKQARLIVFQLVFIVENVKVVGHY